MVMMVMIVLMVMIVMMVMIVLLLEFFEQLWFTPHFSPMQHVSCGNPHFSMVKSQFPDGELPILDGYIRIYLYLYLYLISISISIYMYMKIMFHVCPPFFW